MSDFHVKRRLTGPAMAALVLSWVAAVACFPGVPAATPDTLEPIPRGTEAISNHTQRPAAAMVSPAPTSPPTRHAAAKPTVVATPTPRPIPSPTPTDTVFGTDSASFEEIDLLEELAFGYLSELSVDVGVRTSGTDLERQASEYLLAKFEELGYRPESQEIFLVFTNRQRQCERPFRGGL